MKKLITLLISFFVLFSLIFAEEDNFNKYLSFAQFKKWMTTTKIDGFKFVSSESRGWIGSKDLAYHAMFIKDNVLTLYVQMSKLADFESYKEFDEGYIVEGPFKLEGREAVFIKSENLKASTCYLRVKLKEINACVSIMIILVKENAKLEILSKVYKEFDFDKKLKSLND